MMSRVYFRNPGALRVLTPLLLASALIACEGDAGPQGPQGPEGPAGPAGPEGPSGGVDDDLAAIDKAYAGLGGKDAIDSMTSFVIESEGDDFILGEGFAAEDGSQQISVFDLTATHDLENDAFRLEYSQREFFFIPGVRTFTEVVKGDVGYVEGVDNIFVEAPADGDPQPEAAMSSDRMAALRKNQRLLNPHYLLKDALADTSIVSEDGYTLLDGAVHQIVVIGDAVAPIRVFVHASTGLISKLETVETDPLRRDVPVEVFFADWRGESVKFPHAVFMSLDGELIHAETRSSVTVNGTIDSTQLELPGDLDPAPTFDQDLADRGMAEHQYLLQFAALGIRQEGVQDQVNPVALEEGDDSAELVFHLTGGTHHSLAVKQEDGVVIIEAPLYPARSRAILDWVEDTFPGTPVTHVIATHHHFDHSAGLREFVAAGATVVMQENSRAFFADIFRAPSTISPDGLEENPTEPKFETVPLDGELTLDDANFPITAHHIRSTHSNDMLIVSVPTAGEAFVFVSDLYNPGQPFQIGEGPVETLTGINDAGLTPDTIIGGHGADGGGPLSDLEDIVNPASAN